MQPNDNLQVPPLLNKTGHITSNTTGITHKCTVKVACRSSNLVYAITCKRCGQQYVGQTMVRLKDRFVRHLGEFINGRIEKPVGAHFSQRSHDGLNYMSITILEFIKKTQEPGSHHYQKQGGEKLDTFAQDPCTTRPEPGKSERIQHTHKNQNQLRDTNVKEQPIFSYSVSQCNFIMYDYQLYMYYAT